jgi:hypothetical protein
MSKENRLDEFDPGRKKKLKENADTRGWDLNQQGEIEKMAKDLLTNKEYRTEFLKNPQFFVEAKTGIKIDEDLMKIVWGSVRKLSNDTGQPRKNEELKGVSLD